MTRSCDVTVECSLLKPDWAILKRLCSSKVFTEVVLTAYPELQLYFQTCFATIFYTNSDVTLGNAKSCMSGDSGGMKGGGAESTWV